VDARISVGSTKDEVEFTFNLDVMHMPSPWPKRLGIHGWVISCLIGQTPGGPLDLRPLLTM
jgi:hypothetical protein